MANIEWASGFIDSEGWIGWSKSQRGSLSPTVKVVNSEYEILEVLQATFRVGSLRERTKYPNQNKSWVWSVYGANAWMVLECIQSFLQSPHKQEKLQTMIAMISTDV